MALHFEDRGSGTPLLLLHGFPFDSTSYWPQLDAPPPGTRIIAPDLRGFGQSPGVPGVSTMEAMAEDALAVLDRLQLQHAFVGGVSMGGYVALALTRLRPDRVRGLVLIDTQALGDDESGKARREQVARDVEANGVGALVDSLLPKLFAKTTDPAVKARVEAMMRRANPSAVAAASRGMALRTDARELLSRFSGALLAIVGAEDVITPVERAKQMVELVQGAQLEVVDGAGHLSNLEQPERVNEALSRFIQRHG